MFFILCLMWLIASLAVAWAAEENGRAGFGWFGLAMLLSPAFAILMLIAIPPVQKKAGAPS